MRLSACECDCRLFEAVNAITEMAGKPSSAAGKLSAMNLRASSQRRTTSGIGNITVDTEQDNGKAIDKLELSAHKPDFSLHAGDIKELACDDALKQQLSDLTEKVTMQTETFLAGRFSSYITPETMPDISFELPDEHIKLLKEHGLSTTFTVETPAEHCTDIVAGLVPVATEDIIGFLEQQLSEIVDTYFVPNLQLNIDGQLEVNAADMAGKKKNSNPKLIAALETFEDTCADIREKQEQLVLTQKTHLTQKQKCDDATSKMNTEDVDVAACLDEITTLQSTVDSLDKVIKGQKHAIYKTMQDTYPGVSDVDSSQRTANLAMHAWNAPEGLTESPGKPVLATKMLASIQQICQGWIKQLYPVLMMITLVMANTDPLDPIAFPTIAEALLDDWFGLALGASYNIASSLLYELIARSNPDMIRLAMTPRKTGGDGDPVRTTTMEPENGVSVLMFWLHHCEAELPMARRAHMSLINGAYSLFRSGPIIKACDVFLEHWRKAQELSLCLHFRNVIHRSAQLLRKRGVMFHDLCNKYINGSELLSFNIADVEYNCTEVAGIFLGEVRNIASNLGSDNPAAAEDQLAKSDEMQFKALAGMTHKPEQNDRNNDLKTTNSDWCCSNVKCSGFVNQFTKFGHQKRQGKKLDRHPNSIENPGHLLCSSCHTSWEQGGSIVMSSGKKAAYEPFNNKPKMQGGNGNKFDDVKAKKKLQRKANLTKKKEKKAAEKVELEALRANAGNGDKKVEDSKSEAGMSKDQAEQVVKLLGVVMNAANANAAPEEGEPGQMKEAKAASPMDILSDAVKKMQDAGK